MKKWLVLWLVVILCLAFVLPAASVEASGSRVYTVDVGWEDIHRAVNLMAFFPSTLTIHVGDTVHWVQQTREIHTVSFLAGEPEPLLIVQAPATLPSPLMGNPMVVFPTIPAGNMYDGTTFANSGLMGFLPFEARDFTLTFTQEGNFTYQCLVHGKIMSGTIQVVGRGVYTPTPQRAAALGAQERARLQAQAPHVIKDAIDHEQPPTLNADGTSTYHVTLGWDDGQVMLPRFFPDMLNVKQGDTVSWEYGAKSMDPHTVTFPNGNPTADPFMPWVYQGQQLLLLDPAVLFPSLPSTDLTRNGTYNSGFLTPGSGFSVTIGDITGSIDFLCLLHDDVGMKGTLQVHPR